MSPYAPAYGGTARNPEHTGIRSACAAPGRVCVCGAASTGKRVPLTIDGKNSGFPPGRHPSPRRRGRTDDVLGRPGRHITIPGREKAGVERGIEKRVSRVERAEPDILRNRVTRPSRPGSLGKRLTAVSALKIPDFPDYIGFRSSMQYLKFSIRKMETAPACSSL